MVFLLSLRQFVCVCCLYLTQRCVRRFGFCALCFQTLLFERILKRMKIVRLYGMGLSVMCVSTFAVPTGGLIYWWWGALSRLTYTTQTRASALIYNTDNLQKKHCATPSLTPLHT